MFVYLGHFHSIFSLSLTACLQWFLLEGSFQVLSAPELRLLPGQLSAACVWEGEGLHSLPTECMLSHQSKGRNAFLCFALYKGMWVVVGVRGAAKPGEGNQGAYARCFDIHSHVIPPNPHNSPLTPGLSIIPPFFFCIRGRMIREVKYLV